MPIKRIGNYRVVRKLGKGTSSVVYLVEAADKRKYALKVLRHPLSTARDVKRLRREARICQKLFDNSIAHVIGYEFHEPDHCLLMEYVPGQDLEKLLERRGKLRIEEVIQISWQVCRALEHAHKHNITHHDIKPGNIIVKRNNRAKVTDFGLANIVSESIESLSGAHGLGTLFYSAPEKFRGERGDKRSDLYSLGVVMYQMLTGELPFDAKIPEAYISKLILLDETAPRVSTLREDIPEELDRLVSKALHKQPSYRFQSATEMKTALEQIAKRRDIPLQAIQVSPSLYIKNMLFYWPLERIKEIVTELGASIIIWVLAILFGGLLAVSEIGDLPQPVAILVDRVREIYSNLGNYGWLLKWVLPLATMVAVAVSVDLYRRRRVPTDVTISSKLASIQLSLTYIWNVLWRNLYQRIKWVFLSIVAITFFLIFLYFDFSPTLVGITTILAVFTLLTAFFLMAKELSKDVEDVKRLDKIIFFSIFAIIFFAEFFLLQMGNIRTAFRWESMALSEIRITETTIERTGTPSSSDDNSFISFETGDEAAKSIFWLFIILFATAALLVSEDKLLGLVLGSIAGGIVGSLFGAVVGAAIEFGKRLPFILP
jgi:tRNA A-37 threonylcarbamoyl transferase component Bud32